MTDKSVVLDQPWQIELYALAATIKYLEMEISAAEGHGLRMTSRAPKLSQIRERWQVGGRTKKQVLESLRQLKIDKELEAEIRVWLRPGVAGSGPRWTTRTRESVARALQESNAPESAASLEGNLDIGDYISGLGFIDQRTEHEISAALVWLERHGLAESMTDDERPGKHYMLTRRGEAYARLAKDNPTERKA